MLIIVVISFMICMTPSKVRQLLHWFEIQDFSVIYCSNPELIIWMKLSFNWLATVHSVVNPIIYSFLSDNFRVFAQNFYQLISIILIDKKFSETVSYGLQKLKG